MRSYFSFVIVVVLSFPACSSSSLITDKIYSNELGEEREFCIYRPENFNPEEVYPIIFATDGQIVESGKYKSILDRLIKSETIPPVVLIGAYSNEHIVSSDGMELRYYEYIENDCNEPQISGRFQNHLKFFSVEIRDSVLAKYSIQPDTEKYLFFGCSNGGDYGLTLYAKYPHLFSDYICLSPVGTQADIFNPASTTSAGLYVAYGSKEAESPFGSNLEVLNKKLDSISHDQITVTIFDGGHDRKCWEKEFETTLVNIMNEYR